MFNLIDWQDLAIRAAKTFYQAFAAVFVLPLDALNVGAWESALTAAAAAGLSAAWTLVRVVLFK